MFRRIAPKLVFALRSAAAGAIALAWAANSALAGCGDYVHYVQDGQIVGAHLHSPSAPPGRPCHGPECGQTPHRQPVPASQLIVVAPDRDAVCADPSGGRAPQRRMWVAVSKDPRIDSFFGLRWFRPPRLVG